MAKRIEHPLLRYVYVTLLSLFVVTLFSCGGKEISAAGQREEAEVITARFTNPIEIAPQNSEKCIACHTKTNPITKLASPPAAAGAETGG
ncbi:MAG: hypothetical protein EOM67_04175 [Spirochaetia bacterium]|nr:hypothetical protein [Spirochaetia bacterium]